MLYVIRVLFLIKNPDYKTAQLIYSAVNHIIDVGVKSYGTHSALCFLHDSGVQYL